MRNVMEAREVTTHGVGETANFTIKATGKAFKVLIDGLYSDKVRAVIREIWSNAYDAHCAAGCPDKPFDCQLPHTFDPVFRVRDYGVGMDHATIMHLYTRVFESSKEDTNDQVGKLGLGSKSPFAYTDTFTITAYDGRERRIYSAFIGSNYVPQIALMEEDQCDLPRGIEIQFPVNAADVRAFNDAAVATASGFDVLPNISGSAVTLTKPAVLLSGTGWTLYKACGPATAKQGCVVYPIDGDATGPLTGFERDLLSAALQIEFPIGDLEISASRESLGYDAPTKANIRKRLSEIAKEVCAIYQAQIDDAPTMWQASRAQKALLKSGLSNPVLRDGLTWRGKPIVARKNLSELLSRAKLDTYENGGLTAMYLSRNVLLSATGSMRRHRASLEYAPSVHIDVDMGTTTILFDNGSKPATSAEARIRNWYERMNPDDRTPVLWVKTLPDSLAFRRLLVTLGRPAQIINLADLEKPAPNAYSGVRRPTKVKCLDERRWQEAEIDAKDPIIFVELNKTNTVGHDGRPVSNGPEGIRQVRDLLIVLGVLAAGTDVYGIPQTHKAKIAANPHWVNLWDIARKTVADKYNPAAAALALACARRVQSADPLDKFMCGLVDWDGFSGFIDTTGPAEVLFRQWVTLKSNAEASKSDKSALKLNQLLGGQPVPDFPINFTAEETAFTARYPMVKYALGPRYNHITPSTRHEVLEYINTVDTTALLIHSPPDLQKVA